MLVQRARARNLVERAARSASVGQDWSFHCKSSVYNWTPEDYAALRRAASELNTTPEDLLLVMELESGRNPRRAFCNSKGYPDAIGLNQITPVNAKAMGINEEERLSLLQMTAAEQMPYVVRSFMAARRFKPFPEPPDAITLYQTNIAPATVPNDVVYRQKVFPCHAPGSGSDPYCNNPSLDPFKDGVISRDDLGYVLAKIAERPAFKAALEELQNTPEPMTSPTESSESASEQSPALIMGAAAIGAWLIFKGLS